MTRKIFVIHPSAIIRTGIIGLVEDLFNQEATPLFNPEELDNYKSLEGQQIVLLVDAGIEKNKLEPRATFLKQANKVVLILIRNAGSNVQSRLHSHDIIDTDISRDKFKSMLEPFMHEGQPTQGKSASGLTERETEVVKLVAFGKTNKEIADELCISFHTVISHRKNITEKLGIKSISGLTVYAILNHLIDTNHIDPEALI